MRLWTRVLVREMCEITEGNFLNRLLLSCPHLLNCQSESSVPAAPAANPTCWMDGINWSRCCQHSRQIRAADAPMFLTANCSVPGCLKFTFHRTGETDERAKLKSFKWKLFLAKGKEKETHPTVIELMTIRINFTFVDNADFHVVANVFCPQVVKRLVALLDSSLSDFLQISNQCSHFSVSSKHLSYWSLRSPTSAGFLN